MKTPPGPTFFGLWFSVIAFYSGCASDYSLREQAIRSDLPKEVRDYSGGIITKPTDADVQAAIILGSNSRGGDTLEYAYLTKAPRGFFATDTIYVKVATPLYLISNHAREQSQDYRKIDDSFVRYARDLGAVKISITQQKISTRTWDAIAFDRTVILLRDGVRVDPLSQISAWDGQNPFAVNSSKEVNATMALVTQTAAQQSKALFAQMTSEQKAQVIRTYRTMGLSEDKMATYSGLSKTEIREILGGDAAMHGGKISLSEIDAVFSADELAKPGRYELVFRTPQVASLYSSGNSEIRFPVSFVAFR